MENKMKFSGVAKAYIGFMSASKALEEELNKALKKSEKHIKRGRATGQKFSVSCRVHTKLYSCKTAYEEVNAFMMGKLYDLCHMYPEMKDTLDYLRQKIGEK